MYPFTTPREGLQASPPGASPSGEAPGELVEGTVRLKDQGGSQGLPPWWLPFGGTTRAALEGTATFGSGIFFF